MKYKIDIKDRKIVMILVKNGECERFIFYTQSCVCALLDTKSDMRKRQRRNGDYYEKIYYGAGSRNDKFKVYTI